MASFPAFTKTPMNRIASGSENTPNIEGYVFDGADGSQMALWECHGDAQTAEHVHAFLANTQPIKRPASAKMRDQSRFTKAAETLPFSPAIASIHGLAFRMTDGWKSDGGGGGM